MQAPVNPSRLGEDWGPEQAQVLQRLVREAGQTGSKLSIARLADRAAVSERFIRTLLPGRRRHEHSKIAAVLTALNVTPERFSTLVAEERGELPL